MTDKATRIDLLSLRMPQMRVFHLARFAFFVCLYAWFVCASLMSALKDELHFTPGQVANINIAAAAVTILVWLIVGSLCDRFGPCKTYIGSLLLGAIPALGMMLAQSYETFLLFRLAIGAIGTSLVITQYHTSVVFAPGVVGIANVAAIGWGNAGGGVAQGTMPLLLTAIVMMGVTQSMGWCLTMVVPDVVMLSVAVLYWRHTQDCPEGNFSALRAAGKTIEGGKKGGWGGFVAVAGDYRVWLLFITCDACFGVEIFVHNIVAIYHVDHFDLSLSATDMAAASFDPLALFACALGGIVSDRVAAKRGLGACTQPLCVLMMGEGLGPLGFARAGSVTVAVLAMLGFGLFIHMACGAMYALVPPIGRRALGGVAGITRVGGNTGAVTAGFLLKGMADTQAMPFIFGVLVALSVICVIAVRFSAEHKAHGQALYDNTLAAVGNV